MWIVWKRNTKEGSITLEKKVHAKTKKPSPRTSKHIDFILVFQKI